MSVTNMSSPRGLSFGLLLSGYSAREPGTGKVRVKLSPRRCVFTKTSPGIFESLNSRSTSCLTLFNMLRMQCSFARIDHCPSFVLNLIRMRFPGSCFSNSSRARTKPGLCMASMSYRTGDSGSYGLSALGGCKHSQPGMIQTSTRGLTCGFSLRASEGCQTLTHSRTHVASRCREITRLREGHAGNSERIGCASWTRSTSSPALWLSRSGIARG
jgi:hypothetical protein